MSESKQTELRKIVQLYKGQSDRSKILIACAAIDDALRKIIEKRLAPPINDDTLLSGQGGLSTFSSRIDLVHRLGLISSELASDIHCLRRLRNLCAHELEQFSFSEGRACDIIEGIWQKWGAGSKNMIGAAFNDSNLDSAETKFMVMTSGIIHHLYEDVIKNVTTTRYMGAETMFYLDIIPKTPKKTK